MLQIGAVLLAGVCAFAMEAVAAPIAGISGAAYRQFCRLFKIPVPVN
jgi:hypothetical protein